MSRILFAALTVCLAVSLSEPSRGQGKFGEVAPDFPPGVFTDGNQFRLSDCKGKVVVLYFYEAG